MLLNQLLISACQVNLFTQFVPLTRGSYILRCDVYRTPCSDCPAAIAGDATSVSTQGAGHQSIHVVFANEQ